MNLFGKKQSAPVSLLPTVRNVDNGLSNRSRASNIAQILNYSNTFGGMGGTSGEKLFDGISGSGEPLAINTSEMVMNARRAIFDNSDAKAIVKRTADVTVDTGIKISPTCMAPILGLSDEQADEWNRDTQARFHLYASSNTCHRSRRYNLYGAQQLYIKTLVVDNDQFTRFYFEPEFDSLNPTSFEFIDPLNIGGEGYTVTDGELYGDDGIKRDKKGRETAYIIQRTLANGDYESVEVPHKKFGRTFMVHGFIPEQISQLRGYSSFASILQDFAHAENFKVAHVEKAISQAGIMMTIENENHGDPSNPFAGSVEDGAGPDGSALELADLEDPNLTDEQIAAMAENLKLSYEKFATQKMDGSSVGLFNLKKGDKAKMMGNTAPVTGYDKFVESFTTHLAAAANIPIEVLLMKFSSNYSASRGALLMFYRVAEIYRTKIDADFLTPLYENWLSEEIVKGTINCPGWSDPVMRAAWLAHDLISAPVPNIDPGKLAKANKDNIEMSATTYDRVAQETNGSDGSSNRAANNRQMQNAPVPAWGTDIHAETVEKIEIEEDD